MKKIKLPHEFVNEARSITKISKELADVTTKMKKLANEFYSKPDADRIEEIKDELRDLTPKKKALIDELDSSVAGKDRNIELAIEESVNEGNKYSVQYSDGIRGSKEFRNYGDAMNYAEELVKNKNIQFVSVHKPGMSQTADKKHLIAWFGDGSYWDNKAKKDKSLYDLQLDESSKDRKDWTYKDYGLSKRFSDKLDTMPEKYFNKKGILALAKKLGEDEDAAWEYASDAFGWMDQMKEGKLTEAKGWNDVAKVMDKALKKADVSVRYAKDYVQSLERMAKRDAKQFFADYGDFTEDDFIEDVEYNMRNESRVVEAIKSNIKKKWASTDTMMDDLREFILDAKDAGGKDLVRDIHDALKLMTNYAEGELKESVNEYGGAEWSKITAAKNFLYIDMGKFRDKLKDKKHLKAFDKAKKAFWDVVGPVAEEHHELYESKLNEGMSKGAIKKSIKDIDKQIDSETGGDGEPLDSETLQALEQERARLESMLENKTIKNTKGIKKFGEFTKSLNEASSNFKVLLRTSKEESIGRKIRLGGKRDPGQEVWQKVDKMNWMNLKTKKKLDLNKWAKHADEFHMADKDLQFEAKLTEALARGLKPLLKIGSTITKKDGEDALLDLSDKFDSIIVDDEYIAGDIASHLDMAIELMQDGYSGDATKKLKQFNKACKDVLKGKDIKSAFENVLTERKIQTKRKYTENHPAKTVGKSAKIRNKILEAIKDGKLTQDEFDTLVKELSSDHKRWMKRNGKMFNVSEDGISLSKFGRRILKGIVVNESFADFINE